MVMNFLQALIETILSIIQRMGYLGIFIGMTIESSFFPFPSEIIIVPAGALAAKGEMNLALIFFFGLFGSIAGACINYLLAFSLGRLTIDFLVDKYGRFLFITKRNLEKTDKYFEEHGEVTTFVGRLIFGIRQLISLPAGLAAMNFWKFLGYTALGSGIWISILITIGYFLGSTGIDPLMKIVTLILTLASAIIILAYYFLKRKKK